jgi:NADH-quinone oxidoreductase subunit L
VIIGMHHDQDMRNMGGLRKYMKVTWLTSLVGSLALIGTPFLSGFFSKDSIIEVVHMSKLPGAGFAYFAVMAGVFVTAFYSFRMYFLVFHGKERWMKAHSEQSHDDTHQHDDHHGDHHGLGPNDKPHESPAVVTVPLILLAIPSLLIGGFAIGPMLTGDFFKGVIYVAEKHSGMAQFSAHFKSAMDMGMHGMMSLPFFLAAAGVAFAYYCYMINPALPAAIKRTFLPVYKLLDNKYYMDRLNEIVFAGGSQAVGKGLWKAGDQAVIDGTLVNGSARLVGWISNLARGVQTGYIYHYAFAMIVGVAMLLLWVMPLINR